MVLEGLVSAKAIERRPMNMALLGVVVSSVCVVLTKLFSGTKGLILVFLITMAMVPVVVKLMKISEKRDLRKGDFWYKHGHVIEAFGSYFIAVTITLAFWFALLPAESSSNLFSEQIGEVQRIRGDTITGAFFNVGDVATSASEIILNNIYVMLLSFILSLVFAAGSIFILTWNASVLGVVVGYIAQTSFGTAAAIPLALAGFLPHGVPEILSYLLAGLAGGMLSFAIEKHRIDSPEFMTVAKDSGMIFLASLLLIVVAGVIESFILI
jgi:uncharacterized membrane protein SpoIIM required for sporulation